ATSWTPFIEPGPRVTEDDIRRFEREFSYELPDDYGTFLLEVNGGTRRGPTACSRCGAAKARARVFSSAWSASTTPTIRAISQRRRSTTAPIPSFRRDSSRSATTAWGPDHHAASRATPWRGVVPRHRGRQRGQAVRSRRVVRSTGRVEARGQLRRVHGRAE